MQFSVATILSLVAVASALVVRQNGDCCIPNVSLKQDACTTGSGAAGRCVPGGNQCGGALSCIENGNLQCDDNVIERGNSLCRAIAPGGGLFDGANIIQDLSQASVN